MGRTKVLGGVSISPTVVDSPTGPLSKRHPIIRQHKLLLDCSSTTTLL